MKDPVLAISYVDNILTNKLLVLMIFFIGSHYLHNEISLISFYEAKIILPEKMSRFNLRT